MKLASLNGGRDGRLVVVTDDLAWRISAAQIAPTLQAALDDWDRCGPLLARVAACLNRGAPGRQRFNGAECALPLPRPPHQWADSPAGNRDQTGEIAVITGAVPQGSSREQASQAIRLVIRANNLSLSNLLMAEQLRGLSFLSSMSVPAFSPVAVSPDALGDAWRDGRLHGALRVEINGEPLSQAGADVTLDFAGLIMDAAKTRALSAGTIIGASPTPARRGAARGPALKAGDEIRIDMLDDAGRSIFGAIVQTATEPSAARALEVA